VRPTTTIQNGYNKRDAGTWESYSWDEENKSLKQSDYQPPRINMDLLGELSEIFNQKCSSNKDFGFGSTGFDPFSPMTTMTSNSFNPFYSNTVTTSSGPSQQQRTATTTTVTTPSTAPPSDLIKLESPPTEDLAAIFDPLAIRPVVNKSSTQTLPPTTSSTKNQQHTFLDDFSISVPSYFSHPSAISSLTLTEVRKSFTSSNGVISHSSNANDSTATSRPKGLPLSLPPPPSSKSNFKLLMDKFEQGSVSGSMFDQRSNVSGQKFGQDSSMSSTTTSTTGTPISTLVSPSSYSNLKNPFENDTFLPSTVTNSSIPPVATTTTANNNWQQFE